MAKQASRENSRRLEDTHLVSLSQKLGNLGHLRSLACRGLTLEYSEIEPAINNHSNDIQTAAYEILSTWSKDQQDRVEAHIKLNSALRGCDLGFLANVLEESDGKTMHSTSPRLLMDSDIQRLSQRFTDAGLLRQFAYRGLKMESHDIESAISNRPSDIQAAAHDILRKWQLTQGNREEAFRYLFVALVESNMKSLAEDLKQLKYNSLVLMSEERKCLNVLVLTTNLCAITSNDRPFCCPIICIDIYSQYYFVL